MVSGSGYLGDVNDDVDVEFFSRCSGYVGALILLLYTYSGGHTIFLSHPYGALHPNKVYMCN